MSFKQFILFGRTCAEFQTKGGNFIIASSFLVFLFDKNKFIISS